MQKCVMVPPAFFLLALLLAFTCSRCVPNIEAVVARFFPFNKSDHFRKDLSINNLLPSDALIPDARIIANLLAFVNYLPGSVEH